MPREVKSLLILLAIITVTVTGCYWHVSIWNECRATNSFAYCMRLMSK